MDLNKACEKALELCHYMLESTPDEYVSEEKAHIHRLQIEGNLEEAGKVALNVARYIRNNFDSLIGENYVVEIEALTDPSSAGLTEP